MKSHLTVITFGVDDLERAFGFYKDGLGLSTKGIIGQEFEHGAVAFFDLQHGMKLAVQLRNSIAHDTDISRSPASPTDFTLGHNVASKGEVDLIMGQAKQAGALIVKNAQDTFWGGYSDYFQDPDGHLWEIVWNPNFHVLQWGSVRDVQPGKELHLQGMRAVSSMSSAPKLRWRLATLLGLRFVIFGMIIAMNPLPMGAGYESRPQLSGFISDSPVGLMWWIQVFAMS